MPYKFSFVKLFCIPSIYSSKFLKKVQGILEYGLPYEDISIRKDGMGRPSFMVPTERKYHPSCPYECDAGRSVPTNFTSFHVRTCIDGMKANAFSTITPCRLLSARASGYIQRALIDVLSPVLLFSMERTRGTPISVHATSRLVAVAHPPDRGPCPFAGPAPPSRPVSREPSVPCALRQAGA